MLFRVPCIALLQAVGAKASLWCTSPADRVLLCVFFRANTLIDRRITGFALFLSPPSSVYRRSLATLVSSALWNLVIEGLAGKRQSRSVGMAVMPSICDEFYLRVLECWVVL